MPSPKRDRITILIPTYNRAKELMTTLENFLGTDRDGLDMEIVIIDNNSEDETRGVVDSFSNKLPLRYLFAETPGKNRALNKALEETALGEIVVFTDDDIIPRTDWLKQILDGTHRWPEYAVFGGRIDVRFPDTRLPAWAEIPLIRKFAFAEHHIPAGEGPYPENQYPFGPNYWIRREVFERGYRFDEKIGPHPTRRILGDEILFLKRLTEGGFPIVHIPQAVVEHRIQPEVLSPRGIRRRAVTLGRGAPHVSGLCHIELLEKHPFLWRLFRYGALGWNSLKYLLAFLHPSEKTRMERSVRAILNIWYNLESLHLAREREHSRDSE